MARAFILVLDSVGIGAAADAARFGDAGSDTLGHIAEEAAAGRADRTGLRTGPLALPNLEALGLGLALGASTGRRPPGLDQAATGGALWGYAIEHSRGKDTPSGHWEIAGVPVPFEWGYFPNTDPCFPVDLTDALIREAGLPGILGNRHASGTEILVALGEAHIRTGKPICYTSADSVFQIAAHESHFGLERLYEVCRIARRLVDPLNIGRVIARPFVGETADTFRRTPNRRDYAVPPAASTLLDRTKAAGHAVIGIGKIGDIYAHSGLTAEVKAPDNDALFTRTLEAAATAPEGALVMTNFVDFDTLFGHRRDVAGYAAALEAFDQRLPEFLAALRPGDVAVITADHGCDPTFAGTDHTREHVPVLAFGPAIAGGPIGGRDGFADIAASLGPWIGVDPGPNGRSFLP